MITAADSDVTFVLTSCGRQDLLERTLDSFLKFNTCPIRHYFITEDCGVPGVNRRLQRKYEFLPLTWIENGTQRGQLACIDDAYARVETEYIFHCEDDWEFYKPGFIEKSKAILAHCPGVLQVWLKAEADIDGWPLDPEDFAIMERGERIAFKRLSYGHRREWHGFSFNPGLRRLSDYRLLGKYAPYRFESNISIAYRTRFLSAVILRGDGYVRHLGEGRTVPDPVRNRPSRLPRLLQLPLFAPLRRQRRRWDLARRHKWVTR